VGNGSRSKSSQSTTATTGREDVSSDDAVDNDDDGNLALTSLYEE